MNCEEHQRRFDGKFNENFENITWELFTKMCLPYTFPLRFVFYEFFYNSKTNLRISKKTFYRQKR